MRFAVFLVHVSKALRLPRKSDSRSYKVLHLSHKTIFPKLKIWCSKMQPFSGNPRPDLLTSLMNMSLVLCRPREMPLCGSCLNVPRLPIFLKLLQHPHVFADLNKVHNPLRLPCETTMEHLERPEVFWTCSAFSILTSTCASRRNDVHFFDMSTSKSGPNMVGLAHFDFEMCFAPQRRALFRLLNLKKLSENGVFGTFWLGNVLRATRACTFSTAQLPKVLRTWGVFFHLQMCFASQRRATVHLSSGQMAPHPPL